MDRPSYISHHTSYIIHVTPEFLSAIASFASSARGTHQVWCECRESNPDQWLRRPLHYPLCYIRPERMLINEGVVTAVKLLKSQLRRCLAARGFATWRLMSAEANESAPAAAPAPSDFIRDIVARDVA